MTDLICPGAILDLAPQEKQGYGSVYPSPQNKEGFVLHSMAGSWPAARGRLMTPYDPDDPYTWASWWLSILKDGTKIQHFRDPRAVAWHCGGPGDANPLSAAVGNVALIGIEHEGGGPGNASEPLTPAQLAASIDAQRWAYTVLPELKPPALRASHWEHNWLSNTACPSGRIPWGIIIPALEQEDIFMALTPAEEAELKYFLNPRDWGKMEANGTISGGGPPWFGRKGISPMRMMVDNAQPWLDSVHLGRIFKEHEALKAEISGQRILIDALYNDLSAMGNIINEIKAAVDAIQIGGVDVNAIAAAVWSQRPVQAVKDVE